MVLVAGVLVTSVVGNPVSASSADDAMRSSFLTGKLAEFRHACSDEIVDAAPTSVKMGPGTTAVLVKLTSSKGMCFGQPGENDYLLVEGPSGWRSVLAAEPGSIRVGRPDAKGFAVVTLYGLGMCRITYKRATSGFKATPSKDCHGLNGSPSLLDVAKTVRD